MNKIGIITFHRAVNYGAVLQTYALQATILKAGISCEIIDYRNDFLEKLHNPKNIKKYGSIIRYIYAVIKNRVKKDNRKNFELFREKYLKISTNTYDKTNISESNLHYNLFITGSDQVWNRNCSDYDDAYFLDFVNANNSKYSYAASIGVKLQTDEERSAYRKLLENYKCIYVREKQAKLELESIGIKSEVTLDPTLLLSKNDWLKLAQKPTKFKYINKYLLVYVIVETPSIFKLAKEIAEKHDLEVVYINEMLLSKTGITNLSCITPNEWLWLFANAEFVVTNSFHGTAFSVNFGKQFVVEPLPVKTNVNSRIYDFLNLINLSNRIVGSQNYSNDAFINYDMVNFEDQRQSSLKVLYDIWSQ